MCYQLSVVEEGGGIKLNVIGISYYLMVYSIVNNFDNIN